MSSVVQSVCSSLRIRGEGIKSNMPSHGLRASMISPLIASGGTGAAIVMRSGYADANSFKSYHNQMGKNGYKQSKTIFNELQFHTCKVAQYASSSAPNRDSFSRAQSHTASIPVSSAEDLLHNQTCFDPIEAYL